jgi:hypothetical protein
MGALWADCARCDSVTRINRFLDRVVREIRRQIGAATAALSVALLGGEKYATWNAE